MWTNVGLLICAQGKTVQCKSTSDYDPDQKLSTADKGEGKQPVADPTQRKVFVGGLTSTTTALSLKKVFSAVGEVEHASVRRDKLTNKPRGFGFVTFVEVEAAQRAAEKRVFKIDVRH
jgi:RNA recognition motif-containing protein